MRCEECQLLLEEYFDGELDRTISSRIAAHVDSCAACAGILEQLESEQRAFMSYERGVEVTPTLWTGVRSRMAGRPETESTSWRVALRGMFSLPRFNAPVTAAMVVIAVLLTVAVMKYFDRPGLNYRAAVETKAPADSISVAKTGTEDSAVTGKVAKIPVDPGTVKPRVEARRKVVPAPQTASQLVRDAEHKYLSAIAMLTRDVHKRPARLDLATRARLDGALSAIDQTIASTRRAVHRNPDDPIAVQYMLSAYRKKVDVLREMTSY